MLLEIKLDLSEFHDGDESIKDAIISSIVSEAKSKLNIGEKVDKIIEEQMDMSIKEAIGKWADNLVENYLDKEIVVTDTFGEEEFKGTIRQKLNKQFEDTLEEIVDKNGKSSLWDGKPRFERIVNGIVSEEAKRFVYDTEKEVTKAVKDQLNNDLKVAIGKGVIESIGINKIIDGMRQIGQNKS